MPATSMAWRWLDWIIQIIVKRNTCPSKDSIFACADDPDDQSFFRISSQKLSEIQSACSVSLHPAWPYCGTTMWSYYII